MHRAKVGRRGEPTNPAATTPAPLHAVRHTLATGGKGAGGGGAPEEEEQPAPLPSGAAAQPLGSGAQHSQETRLALLEYRAQLGDSSQLRMEAKIDALGKDVGAIKWLIFVAAVAVPNLPALIQLLSKLVSP